MNEIWWALPTFWSTIWLPQLAISALVFVSWAAVQRLSGKPIRPLELIALALVLACLPGMVVYVAEPI